MYVLQLRGKRSSRCSELCNSNVHHVCFCLSCLHFPSVVSAMSAMHPTSEENLAWTTTQRRHGQQRIFGHSMRLSCVHVFGTKEGHIDCFIRDSRTHMVAHFT